MQAGIIDVDNWLKNDPEANRILNLWEARDRVIPLDDPWQRTATLCRVIDESIAFQVASSKYEIRGIEHFMPPYWTPPPKPISNGQTPEEQRQVFDHLCQVKSK